MQIYAWVYNTTLAYDTVKYNSFRKNNNFTIIIIQDIPTTY